MSIRAPSAGLAKPNRTVLKAGTGLHRVHDRDYAANAFNPCRGSPTRIAPIENVEGRCVPSLYAGDSLIAAIYETIFHDVPAKARLKSVPKSLVTSRAHGELQTTRDIELATLRAVDLKKWRISRTSLIASSPRLYAQTARWAEAVHHQFPNVEGLVWTSNQCDPDSAYLFFGDRVSDRDFKIVSTRDGRTNASFLSDVRMAGRRGGIKVAI